MSRLAQNRTPGDEIVSLLTKPCRRAAGRVRSGSRRVRRARRREVRAGRTARCRTQFAEAFRVDATGDPHAAVGAYLALVRDAAQSGDDPWQVAALEASLDALDARAMPSLGDAAADAALAYRTLDGATIAKGLAGASSDARGPFARGLVARGLEGMALRRGDAPEAEKQRMASGCVREAMVVGPTTWAAVTGIDDPDALDRPDAPIAAVYPAEGAFDAQVPAVRTAAQGCAIGLTRESWRPGVRDVVVDVDVPRAQTVGLVLRAHGAATLRAGGTVVARRLFELGDGEAARFVRLAATAGTLRLVGARRNRKGRRLGRDRRVRRGRSAAASARTGSRIDVDVASARAPRPSRRARWRPRAMAIRRCWPPPPTWRRAVPAKPSGCCGVSRTGPTPAPISRSSTRAPWRPRATCRRRRGRSGGAAPASACSRRGRRAGRRRSLTPSWRASGAGAKRQGSNRSAISRPSARNRRRRRPRCSTRSRRSPRATSTFTIGRAPRSTARTARSPARRSSLTQKSAASERVGVERVAAECDPARATARDTLACLDALREHRRPRRRGA